RSSMMEAVYPAAPRPPSRSRPQRSLRGGATEMPGQERQQLGVVATAVVLAAEAMTLAVHVQRPHRHVMRLQRPPHAAAVRDRGDGVGAPGDQQYRRLDPR